jgi:CheY-like chemotaxis protein
MGVRSLNKEQPQAIRMVFQRLCEDEGVLHLTFGTFRGDFRVLGEAPDRVILGISDLERGQWRLKPGSRLTMQLLDRGLPFGAVVDFQGHGKLHGVEACHVTLPRVLRALDTHRLADYVPDRPVPCPFGDQQNNVRDGLATAFGEDGLELAPPEGTRVLGDMLRLNASSTVDLRGAVGDNLVLPVKVAYFGERTWGLRIADSADRPSVGRYRQWLLEARHHQAQRDLSRFNPGGLEFRRAPAQRDVAKDGARPPTAHPRILVDRDPLVLVLAEGEAFPARLAEAIGRKFGVAALDLGPGPVKPTLAELGADDAGWGRTRLVLIHHHLRSGSAMERCRRLAQDEGCPLPILVAGTEEEADLKRNRAVAAGAVDHLVVEPFHILAIIRTLDETLRLFS